MAKQDVTVELFYSGDWQEHTTAALVRDQIQITRGSSGPLGEQQQPPPTKCTLTFTGWRFNPDNVTSDLFRLIGRNTPIRVTVGTDVRFVGEVASWTPRQSLGSDQTADRWVQVQAAGVTRRLAQGQDPLEDALTRWLPTSGPGGGLPDAWWPMDDPPGSRRARSNVPGVPALRPSGQSRFEEPITGVPRPAAGAPDFGKGDAGPLFGDRRFVSLQAAGELTAVLNLTTGGFRIEQTVVFPSSSLADARAADDANVVLWRIHFGDGEGGGTDLGFLELNFVTPTDPDFDPLIRLFPEVGSSIVSPVWFPYDGQPHRYAVDLVQAGADLEVAIFIDGVEAGTATETSTTRGDLHSVILNIHDQGGPFYPSVVGDWVIWGGLAIPSQTDSSEAFSGYLGEHAGRRIQRLASEQVTGFASSGDLDDTVPLGPQHPDRFLAILREAARTDGGDLLDSLATPAVLYRTHRRRYNQTATLELDYDAAEVGPPLNPTVDDQATRNDVTVKRRDGSTARAVGEDGPLGVDTIGRYPGGVIPVNTLSALFDLESQAGWRLHLGTVGGTRFPRITVDLDAAPGLAGAASAVDAGDLITVDNLPAELTPDLARLLALGYTETIGSHRRRITFNCQPEEPYHIAEVEHADYSVIGSSAATLNVSMNTTETGAELHLGAGSVWVHEADYDVVTGGERMTVTGVSAASGTFPNRVQTLTVTRSVNGVVKAHAAGQRLRLFHQAYIGL